MVPFIYIYLLVVALLLLTLANYMQYSETLIKLVMFKFIVYKIESKFVN